jgi:hypothetical protein
MGRRDPSCCWNAHKAQFRHVRSRIAYRTHLDPYHLYVEQGILALIFMIRWLTRPHLDQATPACASLLRHGAELTRALYGIPAKLS